MKRYHYEDGGLKETGYKWYDPEVWVTLTPEEREPLKAWRTLVARFERNGLIVTQFDPGVMGYHMVAIAQGYRRDFHFGSAEARLVDMYLQDIEHLQRELHASGSR